MLWCTDADRVRIGTGLESIDEVMLKSILTFARGHPLLANRVMRYLVVGGSATAVNYISRFGWSLILPFSLAVPAAYLTGMIFSFPLYRHFVFPQSHRSVHQQVSGFVVVNILGITQVWLVSLALSQHVLPLLGGGTFSSQAIGHGIAVTVPIFSSYVGHKHLSFRGTHTSAS